MKKVSQFERDFIAVEERFPKLKYVWDDKRKNWVIWGELDICDVEGVYWNTFDIVLGVPHGYPYCVPFLVEKSNIIPRDIDWHISKEGFCCYDIDHNLTALSIKGINLSSFIEDKIYPYFANQLYKIEKTEYAGGEYAHHLDGVIQYYMETHNLENILQVKSLLGAILSLPKIGRNERCPCGSSKKVKNCHGDSISTIRSLGSQKVLSDLNAITERVAVADPMY